MNDEKESRIGIIPLGIVIVILVGVLLHSGIKEGITGKASFTKCQDSLHPENGGPGCEKGNNWCKSRLGSNSKCVEKQTGYGCICKPKQTDDKDGYVGGRKYDGGTGSRTGIVVSTTKTSYAVGEPIRLT